LALKHKIHILAASSLNRNHYVNHEKPGIQSFRSSGQLGHDCAVAMLLIGEETDATELVTKRREVELQLVKNRDGARGTIRLDFHLDTQRMYELAFQNQSDKVFTEANDDEPSF
jgi:replicative DNA helicase